MTHDMPIFDLPTMQWIATTAIALASAAVGIVALIFNYRQNRGWEPIILVVSQNYGEDTWWIEFEVWNRRKYPIVVRFVEIKFGNVPLDKTPQAAGDWYIFHNKLCYRGPVTLEPASRHHFEAGASFKEQTLGKSETVRIDVYYFDPIANKRKKLTRKDRYKYTEGC
jgi:hypothetical protein